MITISKGKSLLAIVLAVVLSACGSGGGGGTSTPLGIVASSSNISGVAASGAPLSGATFTITGLTSSGVIATGTVSNSGLYQTSLLAASAPFLISVTDTSVSPVKVYKAIVLASDLGSTMNVTPISDMVANIALNDPSVIAAITDATSTASTTTTATALAAALTTARTGAITAVQTALGPLLTAYGVTDTGLALLTHTFTPTLDAVDKVLDAFTSTCTTTACTIALKSTTATAVLGSTALVIPTTSVADATTAASTVATSLSTTAVIASVQKVAPVVIVLRSVSAWNVGTASAAYTGSISIYNFTDQDYSNTQTLYFESKILQAAGFWNATALNGDGKFQLTLPNWATLPPAQAGGATKAYVLGYSGTGALADAIDLTNCNFGGQKCIILIDDGSLGTVTSTTGSTTDATAAASVRSWSSFVTSLPAAVVSNTGSTASALSTVIPTPGSANNGATVAVPATSAATATTTTTASTTDSTTTATTTAATAPVVTASTAATAGVSVTSAWAGGFNGSLNLLNTSGSAWSGWTVSFDLPASVSNIGSWGNYLLSQSGSTVTFSNQPWNGVITSGNALALGFGGTGSLTTSVTNCQLTYVSAGTTVTGGCSITSSAGTATTTTTTTTTAVPAPAATVTTAAATPAVTTTTTATTPATTTTAAVTTTTTTTTTATGGEPTTMAAAMNADQTRQVYVGYYPTWSDNWFSSTTWDGKVLSNDALLKASKFARVPAVYTHVVAAFASPAFSYTAGATAWTGTGLGFNSSPQDIKAVITLLHARNIKVLLAVGGATYNDWAALSAEGNGTAGPITASLTAVMTDVGFDGLDVDYEVEGNTTANNLQYTGAVKAMRNAVTAAGSDKLLALAGWSTGADCVAGGTTDVACGGAVSYWAGSAGRERAVFSDPTMAAKIDMLNIMSYDAQTLHYDGVKEWQLYRNLFPSTTIVSIGLETAPEGWAGGMLVTKSADALCTGSTTLKDQFGTIVNLPYSVERYINHADITTTNSNVRDGAMLWQILKSANAACGSATVASPGTIGAQISTSYGLPSDNSRAAWQ